MNLYSEQLYRHFQGLPKGDYIHIRDELCKFMKWSLAKYYNKVMGKTLTNYQERFLIESFFNKKIFKIDLLCLTSKIDCKLYI